MRDHDGRVLGTEGFYVDITHDYETDVRGAVDDAVADLAENRIAIEQAKTIMMLACGITAERAFEVLVWRSQETNTKVRALATQFVRDVLAMAPVGSTSPARSTNCCSARTSSIRPRRQPAGDPPGPPGTRRASRRRHQCGNDVHLGSLGRRHRPPLSGVLDATRHPRCRFPHPRVNSRWTRQPLGVVFAGQARDDGLATTRPKPSTRDAGQTAAPRPPRATKRAARAEASHLRSHHPRRAER